MRVIGELDYELLQPVRTSPSTITTNRTIAASGKYEYDITDDMTGYSAIILTVRATYSAAATSGVRVRWLYSPDGSNYDTDDGAENEGNYTDLYFSAGDTIQETLLIPIFEPYVRIQIANRDSAESVTVSAWYVLLR